MAKHLKHAVQTDAFWLWIYDDDSYALVPPPKFLAECIHLWAEGTIAWSAIDIIVDDWRERTLATFLKHGLLVSTPSST